MTTYFPFTPSTRSAPQFQPTLDGSQYSVTVTWSLFGQRYYLNVYTLAGVLVVCIPLIETGASIAVQGATWDQNTGLVTLTTVDPHGYPIGQTVNLTVASMLPDAYNGAFQCVSAGPLALVYPLSSDPGLSTQNGNVSYLISMVAGYFNSTLVYRSSQFEVSP